MVCSSTSPCLENRVRRKRSIARESLGWSRNLLTNDRCVFRAGVLSRSASRARNSRSGSARLSHARATLGASCNSYWSRWRTAYLFGADAITRQIGQASSMAGARMHTSLLHVTSYHRYSNYSRHRPSCILGFCLRVFNFEFRE